MSENLYYYIYASKLRVDADISCIATIIQHSRHYNLLRNITGCLIFDGEHFFQYIEGSHDEVSKLVDKIKVDTRHDHFLELASGSRAGERYYADWAMGYAFDDNVEILLQLRDAPPADLINQLPIIMKNLDFG